MFYSTFPIQSQAKKGEWNYELKRVYTIGILNFIFDKEDDRVISQKKLMDTITYKVYTDALKIIHLEIPKVGKEITENPSEGELWLWLLKFGPRLSYEEKVKIFRNPLFKELIELLLLDKLNDKELVEYRQSMLEEKHYKNFADYARVEGEKVGIEKGRLSEKQELAKKLLDKGMSVEEVSELTGLNLEK